MLRFPTELPLEEIKTVVNFVRGRETDVSKVVEAGWWVAGYAAGRVVPGSQPPLVFAAEPFDLGSLEAAFTKEGLAGFDWDALPWKEILKAVLNIVRKLLEG